MFPAPSPATPAPVVLFGGSRGLPREFAPVVARVVRAALAAGYAVSVGDSAGADLLALAAAVAAAPARLSVYSVGEPHGAGWLSCLAPWRALRSAQAAGARLVWLAGGPLSLPPRARLVRRSLAALAPASLAVFFLCSPASVGSLRVGAAAAEAGKPVFVFTLGFAGAPAPLPGCAGQWLPASLAGLSCWSWQPAQASLF